MNNTVMEDVVSHSGRDGLRYSRLWRLAYDVEGVVR